MTIKFFILASLVTLSVSSFANEKTKKKETKAVVAKAATKAESTVAAKDVPCDSKEDILKKLEEKKKAEAEAGKPKAFSLKGGDTGCSVK